MDDLPVSRRIDSYRWTAWLTPSHCYTAMRQPWSISGLCGKRCIDKYLVLHVSHMANGELSKLLENPPHDGGK